jgi:very-short-patch-repair endonuclease
MTDALSRSPDLVKNRWKGSITDRERLGRRILEAAPGQVHVIGGIGIIEAHACLDPLIVPEDGPMALLLPLQRFAPADALIEDLARHLSRVALQCWPVWYGDADFSGLKRDTLGRNVVRLKLAAVALGWPRLSQDWARAAVALAQDRRVPRPARVHWSIEIIQLCLAIHPTGLVLVLDAQILPNPAEAHALVHALELVADKAVAAVVVLCECLPEFVSPYDRILGDAVTIPPSCPAPQIEDDEVPAADLVPVSGRPHPLREVEKRVAQAIAAAPDLAHLFRCNQIVETVRGSRPRVDLLWQEGRLVVELDGYADHVRRDIFSGDRHRDYELTLSGYTVLRIANDEIHRDIETAIDKIRDVVACLSTKSPRNA